MKKLNLDLFNEHKINNIHTIKGGGGDTGGGKYTDGCTQVSWSSDTSNSDGTKTLHGYKRTNICER